jgi:hypothetical protein
MSRMDCIAHETHYATYRGLPYLWHGLYDALHALHEASSLAPFVGMDCLARGTQCATSRAGPLAAILALRVARAFMSLMPPRMLG